MKKKNRKNLNIIKNNFLLSLNFLRESKVFIYSIIGIFFFFVLMGFFVPVPEEISNQIIHLIEELLEKIEGLSQFELIEFIFLNNLQSSFLGMILGIFFGIFSVIVAIANGFLLGFVASASVASEGIFILWRLLPHGIFELPAIFISLGLGLKLSTFIFAKNKLMSLKNYLKKSLITFLFIILPLLIIAAIIEGSLIFLSS
jgi:stage II sporulation protein M